MLSFMKIPLFLFISLVFLISIFNDSHAENHIERAKEIYRIGHQHFKDEEYRSAIFYFKRTYQIKTYPDFSYNMACCHDFLEEYDKALSWYKEYLRAFPTGWAAGGVIKRVHEIENPPTVAEWRTKIAKGDSPDDTGELVQVEVKKIKPGYLGVQNENGAIK